MILNCKAIKIVSYNNNLYLVLKELESIMFKNLHKNVYLSNLNNSSKLTLIRFHKFNLKLLEINLFSSILRLYLLQVKILLLQRWDFKLIKKLIMPYHCPFLL